MARLLTALLTVATRICAAGCAKRRANAALLSRRYIDGNRIQYRMRAHEDRSTYEVRIIGTTRKASGGRFVEELAWEGHSFVTSGRRGSSFGAIDSRF